MYRLCPESPRKCWGDVMSSLWVCSQTPQSLGEGAEECVLGEGGCS